MKLVTAETLAAIRNYVFASVTINATDRHRLLTFIDEAPPDPRLDALLAALVRIRDMDYRGNPSPESQIARDALAAFEEKP